MYIYMIGIYKNIIFTCKCDIDKSNQLLAGFAKTNGHGIRFGQWCEGTEEPQHCCS